MSKQSMEIATNKPRKKKTNPGRQKMGFEKLAEKLTGKKKDKCSRTFSLVTLTLQSTIQNLV